MASTAAVIGAIIVVIIIVGIAYVALSAGSQPAGSTSVTTLAQTTAGGASTGNTSYATVPVGMTDPPSVPTGTQAVLVTYSNVQIQTSGGNGTHWVDAAGSGTFNALAVVNASQTIAKATVAANSDINAVRMNITSVKVIVNGTTYTATAPSTITASVSSNSTVRSNSAVLVDIATDVQANGSTSGNSTSHAYVYSTSAAKAVLVANTTISVNVGTVVGLSSVVSGSLGLNLGGSAGTSANSTSSGYTTVPVGITDPPSVPAHTQAVIISYSNVQVRASNGAWTNATGSGTVNALAVVNSSQTIADARLTANSTIEAVRMHVNYVKVVVNGTTYNATSPSTITANVSSSSSAKSDSAVLMDLSSNVTATTNTNYYTSTTTYAYTASSAKAVLTTNASVSVNVGAMVNLSTTLRSGLGLTV